MVNMLNSLSRNQQLPQIAPRCGCVDPLPGRLPFQGYESPCSGRHYCLRGMDYYATGAPCTERRPRPPCADLPTVRFAGPRASQLGPAPRQAPPPDPSPAPSAARRVPPHLQLGPAARPEAPSLQPALPPSWAARPALRPQGLSGLTSLLGTPPGDYFKETPQTSRIPFPRPPAPPPTWTPGAGDAGSSLQCAMRPQKSVLSSWASGLCQ